MGIPIDLPGRQPRTAARAGWRARRRRRMIARGYEAVVRDAVAPDFWLTARVPVQRDQVLDAAPDIERLVDRLRDVERPLDEHALDEASALLCDGAGPIFMAAEPGTLRRRVRVMAEAME